MSWQAYVDTNLVGTGHISKAAIHGLDGNPWASSSGFTVTPAEAAALIAGCADPTPMYSGIYIAGKKYMFLRNEPDRSVYGKEGSDNGCFVIKTGQCVLIAVYEGSNIQPRQAATVVEKLADYLIEVGY
ncbi:profilin-2 [Sphaeroforma arctica JP610]|uniref:Profilin n=1 Tax=Sphaeroforma arctica JP610 TaxID=667725 RepID=A0A0L0G0Z9_9EUKA|nr:profilin-2 [Sphaeroforma arctica JP610]KNC82797.1 profilin-2 [Sphaeroforma arctica JP610]|eukprot:XP_014156699.1 profilin-2 [Sphaeroforma arctica JP610]